jgi:hypothetical protein
MLTLGRVASVLVVLALTVVPVGAVPFVGSPSPALNPIFGTLIDFDDQATGTPVLVGDYVGQGVAAVTELEGLGTFARYASPQSAPNYIGTGPNGERGGDASLGWDGTILFQFAGLAGRVGIGVADSAGGPETINAYGIGLNLLESLVVPSASNIYVGFNRPTADIKFFSISGDFFAVDDLQHDAGSLTPVPEPATLLLVGTTLAGGMVRYQRRRRQS